MKYSIRSLYNLVSSDKRIALTTTALLLVYIAYYTNFIIQGGGLPYVTDGNETYSSMVHAYNLWHFDFFTSFGLADEAVSPDPAAHPMIHTHQGNFPRLFAFLLYALGARGAESQIWITTLTVGAASVLIANAFFRRIGGSLFAAVAILLMMTDYLLFAQWQVNTYRVWHGFFFFAALLCTHGLYEWKRWQWAATTIFLYACLYYWELVFATFVAITAGLYTGWICRQNLRLAFVGWITQGTGVALGLTVLVTQLVLYLGWNDFRTDVWLTFVARNQAPGSQEFLAQLKNFYQPRNIAFLYNIQESDVYSGIFPFIYSLFQNVFEISTPFLSLLGICLAAAAFLGDSRHPGPRDVAVMYPSVSYVATALLIPGSFILIWALADGEAVIGIQETFFNAHLDLVIRGAAIGMVLAMAIPAAIGLRAFAARIAVSGTPAGIGRCFRAGLFLFGVGILIIIQGDLYHQGHAILWAGTLTVVPLWVARGIVFAAALIGALAILAGRRAVLGIFHRVPSSLAPFFICGALAYVVIYKFSSGYLHTGYLLRLVPFPVFMFDTLLALGLFTGVAVARTLGGKLRKHSNRLIVRPVAIVASLVVLSFVGCWFWVQAQYSYLMPPTQIEFIKYLELPSFKSRGIVTNNYALPFGFVGKTWAYGFASSPWLSESTPMPEYMWFADRRSNPEYLRPELFICLVPGDLRDTVMQLARPEAPLPRCSLAEIVHRARLAVDDGSWPHVRLLAQDNADRWAIVRLEWGTDSLPNR